MTKFSGLALPVNETARMTIAHPYNDGPLAGAPLENAERPLAYIDLLPLDSDAAQKLNRDLTTRRLNQRNRTPLTVEELEAEQLERLAHLTKGWQLFDLEGQPIAVPCTEANARELYAAAPFRWLREQVEHFLSSRANFTKRPSPISAPRPNTTSASTES